MMGRMDEIDLRIAEELMIDAQIPFRRIALKLGISPETVRKRYERMKREGQILLCSVSIDFSKIGYEGIVFLMIESMERSETSASLKEMRNVISVNRTIGDFDILVVAVVQDIADLLKLVNEVRQLPKVNRVELFLGTLNVPFPGGFVVQGMKHILSKEQRRHATQEDIESS
jgi:Lrp/AsnC family transcriptional regulator, regulator for asnA, asnC and gidA